MILGNRLFPFVSRPFTAQVVKYQVLLFCINYRLNLLYCFTPRDIFASAICDHLVMFFEIKNKQTKESSCLQVSNIFDAFLLQFLHLASHQRKYDFFSTLMLIVKGDFFIPLKSFSFLSPWKILFIRCHYTCPLMITF